VFERPKTVHPLDRAGGHCNQLQDFPGEEKCFDLHALHSIADMNLIVARYVHVSAPQLCVALAFYATSVLLSSQSNAPTWALSTVIIMLTGQIQLRVIGTNEGVVILE
jgi:hypothetical protein